MRQKLVIIAISAFVVTIGISLATTQHLPNPNAKMETVTFAGGCFWGLEEALRQIPGVTDTVVGYTGGTSKNPTYEEVSSHRADHLEGCRVTYDPTRVSYQQLVAYFLETHDRTIVDRKSPYLGSPARLVIFFQNPAEEKIAEAAKAQLAKPDATHHSPLVQVLSEGQFYRAEEYHQRYLEKHGLTSCRIDS
jgi:peptide-methionine (S)-S-oxide reductase